MKLACLLIAAAALPVAVGCSSETGEEPTSAEDALVAPAPIAAGSFQLFGKPHYAPESSCDMYTKLDVKDLSAHLEEAFVGPCATFVAVDKNPRDYHLVRESSSCGSSIYSGTFKKNGETWSIKLTDHRTRLCRDVIPAKIVVEETHRGSTTKGYSADGAPASSDATFEGELASVVGIGGESTGVAIMTKTGMFELILDAGERAQFVDGKKAKIKGKKTTLSGVETHGRPAIDVSSMLVCPNPGWVDCMPGPSHLSPLCGERTWVRANCEGVDFAD